MTLDLSTNMTNQNQQNNLNPKEEKKSILPSINLPKGGGAINGIGEKFQVNAATGTGSASIPIPVSPGRNGFAPQLGLGYDSGSGNSPFGLGWSLSIPSIRRKTSKELPQYNDAEESDTFLLSGAEDLVPFLDETNNWERKILKDLDPDHTVYYYRPRTEGLFARIEKWVHHSSGNVFWKTTSKENITSYYGRSNETRIYDSENPQKIFEWLLEASYDNKGSIILYQYKQENKDYIDPTSVSEQHRIKNNLRFNQKYLKTILYGNEKPNVPANWNFQIVLDYGEHDLTSLTPQTEVNKWLIRKDPFSSYLSGFEIRTYRLCKHILLFHHFTDEIAGLGENPVLVRSTNLIHSESSHITFLISASQTGYIKKGTQYNSKSTPPVEYFYTEPNIANAIESISPENLENLPVGVDGLQYHWVDLEGEGIDGILTEQAGAWFYKSNLGKGEFSKTKLISSQPSLIGNGRPQLQDIDGNGEKELTILNNQISGFYPYTDGQWQNYSSFEQMPNLNWQDPNIKFLDLNGDGFADILITEDDVLRWFPSKAKEGYGNSQTISKSKNEDEGPALIFADADQSIYLADMSGSGLMDIVRIRNQSVCYWPNLGYGKFGAKVMMENAPLIDYPDQFNQRNIRLTDIDGSGTTDILYLGNKQVKFWTNQSGNSWSEEKSLPVFPDTNNLVDVQLADVLGKGTPCLVWSSPLPNDQGQQLKYVDLMKDGKPYLMNRVVNNMGKEDRVTYLPSTHFYLEDKKNGKPWITKLHFPVYVVAKTETYDLISNSRLSVTYKYHHGYYDGEEREFRGFGMVEQQDEEEFNEKSNNAEDAIHFIPPIYTKTWFHTGAYVKLGIISDQYKQEYYNGDPDAYLLPDTVIENRENLNYVSEREACRALRGQALRTEVYALDKTEKEIHPYTVSEINFAVRQIQPHQNNKFAVYLVHPNESFSYHYERDPTDPRMSHSITIEVDNYGAIVSSAEVVYPRRNTGINIYPEQQQLHIILQENIVHHLDKDDRFYTLGIPLEQKTFEVTGVKPEDKYFSIKSLKLKLPQIQSIDFSDEAKLIQPEKRLLSWTENFYWDKTQNRITDIQEIECPILPHHSEAAVFTHELIEEVFGNRLSIDNIKDDGKYIFKNGYWWDPGFTIYYKDIEHFFLPFKTTDPWGNQSQIFYEYDLIPTITEDTLGNKTKAVIDYITLSPSKVVDVHGNISEAISDPLGMVIATSMHGMEEGRNGLERKGDTDISEYTVIDDEISLNAIVADPEKYLQGATSYFYYDVDAFRHRLQPPQFISLTREIHVSELEGEQTSPIHIVLGYSDGFGRNLQQKIKVEPGVAYLSDGEGGLVIDIETGNPKKEWSEDRWLSSGRTIYNNKEKPYKQYEPFYISGFAYEKENELTWIGVTPIIHYDPLMRVIRTDAPKGFFSKVEFNSWEVSSYDFNDTIKDSDYWTRWINDPTLPEEEQNALKKAEAHYNTPHVTILDSLGRAFISYGVKENIFENPDTKKYINYTTFNITGQPLKLTDPRQYELNKSREQPIQNFTNVYDMWGDVLYTKSIDAGESRSFVNVMGNPILSWTSRGFINSAQYDQLHRPLELWYDGEDLNGPKLIEKFIYGNSSSGQNKNLQLLQHYDQTGLTELEKISFKGESLQSFKQFCKTYDKVINWNDLNDTELEEEKFHSSSKYDALGRATETIAPDKSISKPIFNFSGQLKKVLLDHQGKGEWKSYVENVEYNEKGQRESILYGNNTLTKYEYEKNTYRLTHLTTTRLKPQEHEPTAECAKTIMQDLFYTYDPVGNITNINDQAQRCIYFDNHQVIPLNKYTYDSFYQLIYAKGREHIGQNQPYSQEDNSRKNLAHPGDENAMSNYEQYFNYDDAGNKEKVQHVGDHNRWSRYFITDEYSNRLLMSGVGSTQDDWERFSYDTGGNMKNIATADFLTWNYKNEISHLKRATTEAWYNYDSKGQRCRKVVKDGIKIKVRYYIGGYEIYREFNGDSPQLERQSLHVSDDTGRIVLIETKTKENGNLVNEILIRYQYGNHLGSAALELDNKTKIISYEEYYPYGCTSYQAVDGTREVPTKRYRYTGMERDEESGLNYHTARYYVPWLGRWLCTDPAGIVDGLNLYRYCIGNPLVLVDTNGKQPSRPGAYQELFNKRMAELILASGNIKLRDRLLIQDKGKWRLNTNNKTGFNAGHTHSGDRTSSSQELAVESARTNQIDGSMESANPGMAKSAVEIEIGNGVKIPVERFTARELELEGVLEPGQSHGPDSTGWTQSELEEQVAAKRAGKKSPSTSAESRWENPGDTTPMDKPMADAPHNTPNTPHHVTTTPNIEGHSPHKTPSEIPHGKSRIAVIGDISKKGKYYLKKLAQKIPLAGDLVDAYVIVDTCINGTGKECLEVIVDTAIDVGYYAACGYVGGPFGVAVCMVVDLMPDEMVYMVIGLPYQGPEATTEEAYELSRCIRMRDEWVQSNQHTHSTNPPPCSTFR